MLYLLLDSIPCRGPYHVAGSNQGLCTFRGRAVRMLERVRGVIFTLVDKSQSLEKPISQLTE
jgi:hypothetical protein